MGGLLATASAIYLVLGFSTYSAIVLRLRSRHLETLTSLGTPRVEDFFYPWRTSRNITLWSWRASAVRGEDGFLSFLCWLQRLMSLILLTLGLAALQIYVLPSGL